MTRLLVSVSSPTEARAAVQGGAQLIDLKDPSQGALGSVDSDRWPSIVAEVPENTPVSVALGELVRWKHAGKDCPWDRIRFAKCGLSGLRRRADWRRSWLSWSQSLPSEVNAVLVAYADEIQADSPPVEAIVEFATSGICQAVLIDTFDKSAGSLVELRDMDWIAQTVRQLRDHSILSVIAGSLTIEHFERVLSCAPDFVAVRGAACAQGRDSDISADKVAALRDAIESFSVA